MVVLIVEDKLIEYKYCKSLILEVVPGCKILYAETSEQALCILDSNIVDAIFIDRELPGIDGFSLADKIRDIDLYHLLPIIFVTGVEDDEIKVMARFKNYEYILKPYNKEQFYEKAEAFLLALNKKIDVPNKKTTGKAIKVNVDGIKESIHIRNILYVEVFEKHVTILTTKRIYKNVYMTLNELINNINDPFFIKCHKSYAVNIRRIYSISRVTSKTWNIFFEYTNSITCPVSAKYYKEVKKMFDSKANI